MDLLLPDVGVSLELEIGISRRKLGNKARLGNLLEDNQSDEPEFRDKKNKSDTEGILWYMHLRWFRVKSGYNSSYFMEGSVSWSVPAVKCIWAGTASSVDSPQIDLANYACSNVITIEMLILDMPINKDFLTEWLRCLFHPAVTFGSIIHAWFLVRSRPRADLPNCNLG
ncbi:hypothetical protein OPV22_023446 [Ensete ventricosum]|uniref:Uncharacterized protein n=1 Tax=Ensete ventricosum TaxID=4639 RepID=A0AAV8QI09_ENSVE|nr:hypothetical protein OPV22_023446 [Ensete ventricosum]